jgi:putative FmdB family regulatory protein
MPTYEYACTTCDNRFEVFQRIEDDPPTVCERCGGTLRKVFHPAGIVFKGSGFYATDSRRKAKKGADGGEKKSTGDKETKESKTSSSESGSGGSGSDASRSGASSSEKPA